MNIEFNIHYKTYFGQILVVCGNCPQLGNGTVENAPEMTITDIESGLWQLNIEFENKTKIIQYKYYVKESGITPIAEWGNLREFNIDSENLISLYDAWRSSSDPLYALFSKAIGETIFNYTDRFKPITLPQLEIEKKRIRFKISVPRIKKGHQLAIMGNIPALGEWDSCKAVKMSNANHPCWETELYFYTQNCHIEYKYCIIDAITSQLVSIEDGFNRKIDRKQDYSEFTVITDEHFRYPFQSWKCAGVAVPVFSLRRNNGYGIGEFTDIKLLVDWARSTNLKIIQLLPINDTTATHSWIDSYPYSGISVYALHPIYVNIQKIGKLKTTTTQQIIDNKGSHLNSLDKIDYESVIKLKWFYFKEIFNEQKEIFLSDSRFLQFFNANKNWLQAYAAFCYLRDLYNTADFKYWEKYSIFKPQIVEEICDPHASHFHNIAIHYFVQFHAHQQLEEVAKYARKNGIALKGDIPIGIYRHSVDAWIDPQLYNMNAQAGAPPDDFSKTGQNWRFPTYNWDIMANNNYKWWQNRLQQMATYFDAFRIDHILGFFRIWEIPENQVEGLLGRFNPSIPFSEKELLDWGIEFNLDRMCRPYIRHSFLNEIFKQHTNEVVETYLEEFAPNCYNLKAEYNTQRKIETALISTNETKQSDKVKIEQIKNGLYKLVAEVIFLEAPNADNGWYVPRYCFHDTFSYKELNPDLKKRLNELYNTYFFERNEHFWATNALKKLPTLKNSTNMLLCGEDLGMVPKCVPQIMGQLGILSLEVQRMPKEDWIQFGDTTKYPYLSVATPSSHDTSTIRGWWEEDPTITQQFYNTILKHNGLAPSQCNPKIVKQIIEQHLESPSMIAIFPIQDLLGISENLRLENVAAERINQPANPNNYWCYRMHLALEILIKETDFNAEIKTMVNNSNRGCLY